MTSSPAALTVTAAVLTEIDIAPDDQYIPVGGQYPLTLTGTYSDNTTQTITNATWSSSDSTLASVDPNTGIVTGVANSNNNPVTITASYGGMTSTTTVYITSAVAESLQLTPVSASIASGTTQQYQVNVGLQRWQHPAGDGRALVAVVFGFGRRNRFEWTGDGACSGPDDNHGCATIR